MIILAIIAFIAIMVTGPKVLEYDQQTASFITGIVIAGMWTTIGGIVATNTKSSSAGCVVTVILLILSAAILLIAPKMFVFELHWMSLATGAVAITVFEALFAIGIRTAGHKEESEG